MVFQGGKPSISLLEFLLKLRSFKWIVAFERLHKDLESLWGISPIGSSKKANETGPLCWNAQFKGFTDGAWKKGHNGKILSGICGIFLNYKNEVAFSFSENSEAKSPLEAELKAILFLHEQFRISP